MTNGRLSLRLMPLGRLVADRSDDAPEFDPQLAMRLADAFARASRAGLLQLGGAKMGQLLPPAFAWWRTFAARYISALCLHVPAAGSDTVLAKVPGPDAAERASLMLIAPMMPGAEYLTPEVLQALWDETCRCTANSF